MPAYQQPGFLSTTSVDGRSLRVVYLHHDDSRDEAKINEEVGVLRSFAAACTKGDKVMDVWGNFIPKYARQCDVIWVRKSQHASKSDDRPHLAIQISTDAGFMESPKKVVSDLHVYSNQDDTSRGYASWRKMYKSRNCKMSSAAVQESVARALAHDFGAGSGGPSPSSSPEAPSSNESQ